MTIKTIYDYEEDSVDFQNDLGNSFLSLLKTPKNGLHIQQKCSQLGEEAVLLLIEHCQRFVDGESLCPPQKKPPRLFYQDDQDTGDRVWGTIGTGGCVDLVGAGWGAEAVKGFHRKRCSQAEGLISIGHSTMKVTFIDEE